MHAPAIRAQLPTQGAPERIGGLPPGGSWPCRMLQSSELGQQLAEGALLQGFQALLHEVIQAALRDSACEIHAELAPGSRVSDEMHRRCNVAHVPVRARRQLPRRYHLRAHEQDSVQRMGRVSENAMQQGRAISSSVIASGLKTAEKC
jgi:hypothetical protein